MPGAIPSAAWSRNLAARGGWRIGGTAAADQYYAGGEGIGHHADAYASRAPRSVRIGQVPVIANPDRITASRNVSQPVLAVPVSPLRL